MGCTSGIWFLGLGLEHIPCHEGTQAQEQVLLCRRQLFSHQIFCSEIFIFICVVCHVKKGCWNWRKKLYLNNVMKEVSTRNKLHDKEEPLFGLESSIEGSEKSAVISKSKDLSLEEGGGGAVLAQDVLLAHRLDRTQLRVGLPLRQNDLSRQ